VRKLTLGPPKLCAAISRLVENTGKSYDPPHSGRIWGYGSGISKTRDFENAGY